MAAPKLGAHLVSLCRVAGMRRTSRPTISVAYGVNGSGVAHRVQDSTTLWGLPRGPQVHTCLARSLVTTAQTQACVDHVHVWARFHFRLSGHGASFGSSNTILPAQGFSSEA
eukprot:37845-Chlamydomonas_euryale.AAC.5